MRFLITGGCGFIGSHFVRHLLSRYPEAEVVNLDALTYAAHPDTRVELDTLAPGRYRFVQGDIASDAVSHLLAERRFDAIVNFAAETHVDRSILDPAVFVSTNIKGVQTLLTAARDAGGVKLVHVSTDEVYGSLAPGAPPLRESAPLDPNSPYAASKASADLLVLASERTYGQPAMITRCTNNFGPYQFPEKLIPLVIANAIEDKPVPVYGDGGQVRDWIYVEDHCAGIDAILQRGISGQIYNISARSERDNLTVVRGILKLLGKSDSLIQHVGDRPAHDRRYGLDATKIAAELGWKPVVPFEEGLARTVKWYRENPAWWKKLRDEKYFNYYSANYAGKFRTSQEGVGS